MSTSVTIYADQVPEFDDTVLRIDEATMISLPLAAAAAAQWCEDFAAVLLARAAEERVRHEQQQCALLAAQREVEAIRAARRHDA